MTCLRCAVTFIVLHVSLGVPTAFSCQSYELFVGQEKGNIDDNNREKMSIRSDDCAESLSEHHTRAGQSKSRKMSAVSTEYRPAAGRRPQYG